jgi:transposase
MRRVGLDLALTAPHRAVVYEGAQRIGKSFAVKRTKAGMEELERRALAGTDGPCEFIMEPTGLAWLPVAAELARRGHRTYVPKAQKTHALRQFLSKFAKTDGLDAKAQALVRHIDPDGVYELHVPTAAQTSLRLYVKQRARVRLAGAKAQGRIQAWLVLANPFLAAAFDGELFSTVGVAFLRRYLDPFRLQAAGKAELRRFWQRQSHGPINEERFEAVWSACATACEFYAELRAAARLPFDYATLQDLVKQELERLEFLDGQTAELEAKITQLYRQVDPERLLEREVPGVAATIAPAIEAYAHDIERFGSAKRFAAFFGYVPRTNQTGGKDGKPRQRLTKGGPSLLKQYLYLAAETARRCDPTLAATYDKALARGKHHYGAVCIVAHKLLRKIYALLKLRAAARSAQANGQPTPVVHWDYVVPETGEVLTKREARAWVEVHFPSKARKQQAKRDKKAAEATPQVAGSSNDVTKVVDGAPPAAVLADVAPCENSGESL